MYVCVCVCVCAYMYVNVYVYVYVYVFVFACTYNVSVRTTHQHGQSEANAAEAVGEEHRAHTRWRDSQLTPEGRAQATAWEPSAAHWGVGRVLVSPLMRAIETAAHVFASSGHVPLQLCASARECWWDAPENRGRLAAGLTAGTETGRTGEPRLWRCLSELPGNCFERLEGLEALECPTPGQWAPEDEAGMTAEAAEAFWHVLMDNLCLEIVSSSCKVLAVVCHRGVIEHLFGVAAPNAGVVKTRWWMEGTRCKREVIGNVLLPPLEKAAAAPRKEEEAEEGAGKRRKYMMQQAHDAAHTCMCTLFRAALASVEQLASITACDQGTHASGSNVTARSLQALLAMRPQDDAAIGFALFQNSEGGGRGGGGEEGGGAEVSSQRISLDALDHLVRLGFAVLTEPCAHATEPPHKVAAWRQTFALAATLRGNQENSEKSET